MTPTDLLTTGRLQAAPSGSGKPKAEDTSRHSERGSEDFKSTLKRLDRRREKPKSEESAQAEPRPDQGAADAAAPEEKGVRRQAGEAILPTDAAPATGEETGGKLAEAPAQPQAAAAPGAAAPDTAALAAQAGQQAAAAPAQPGEAKPAARAAATDDGARIAPAGEATAPDGQTIQAAKPAGAAAAPEKAAAAAPETGEAAPETPRADATAGTGRGASDPEAPKAAAKTEAAGRPETAQPQAAPAASPAADPAADPAAREAQVLHETTADLDWRLGIDRTGVGAAGRTADSAPAQAARAVTVSQQLTVAIGSTSDGQVEVRLDPPELGRVQIHLHTSEEGVRAVIMAERPETQDLLRRHAEMLARDLGEQGFETISLEFAAGNETGGQSADEGEAARSFETSPDAGGASPRQAIETAARGEYRPRGGSLSSLDIRL